MTTSLSQRQSLIRAAIARLEAGADVPVEKVTWLTRDDLIQSLRSVLTDHDDGICLAADDEECWGVTTARLVLGEPEGDA